MKAMQEKLNGRSALALGTGLVAVVVAVAMIVLGSPFDSGSAVAGQTATAHASPGGQPGPGARPATVKASASSVLNGIPQHGLVLGKPDAKVELVEFGDLVSPVCKELAEEVLPSVIRTQVATGKSKLVFRNFGILTEEGKVADAAAVAAGEGGRGWNFLEAFFANQGDMRLKYVDTSFLHQVAIAAGVEDLTEFDAARTGAKAKAEVAATTKEGHELGLMGVPTLAVRGPGTHGLEVLPVPQTAASIEQAIKAAG